MPTATLVAAMDYPMAQISSLPDKVDLGDVQPGWLAQIGEDPAQNQLVDPSTGSNIAITRGVLDTVPHQWPIGRDLFHQQLAI